MQLKKASFILSFALSSLLVIGTTGFASELNNGRAENMMNANENGMSNMMNAMNSTEGQEMMNTCISFVKTIGDAKETK